jgi:hypothetical protein
MSRNLKVILLSDTTTKLTECSVHPIVLAPPHHCLIDRKSVSFGSFERDERKRACSSCRDSFLFIILQNLRDDDDNDDDDDDEYFTNILHGTEGQD